MKLSLNHIESFDLWTKYISSLFRSFWFLWAIFCSFQSTSLLHLLLDLSLLNFWYYCNSYYFLNFNFWFFVAGIKKYSWFCLLILCSANLLNHLLMMVASLQILLTFLSRKSRRLWIKEFYFSFPIWITSVSFSLFYCIS